MRSQPQCCLSWCRQQKRTISPKVHLYTFPISRQRQLEWLEKVNVDDLKKLPRAVLAQIHICSDHFEEKFKTVAWPKRKPAVTLDAVPTLKLSPPPPPPPVEHRIILKEGPFSNTETEVICGYNGEDVDSEQILESEESLEHNDASHMSTVTSASTTCPFHTQQQSFASIEPDKFENSAENQESIGSTVEMVPLAASKPVSYQTFCDIISTMEEGISQLQNNLADRLDIPADTIANIWKNRDKMRGQKFDQIVFIQGA